jgi:signal transduction histidine kinase
MSKRKSELSEFDAGELRRRAESMAQWLIAHPLHSESDTQKLLHELQVHQVELEMQNAELRHAHDETAAMLRQVRLLNERLETSARDSSASGGETEAAVRAKSAALATMCDKMRIPLKAITGMSQQIRRSGVSAGQAKCLDKLDTASQQLSGIIDSASDRPKRAPR